MKALILIGVLLLCLPAMATITIQTDNSGNNGAGATTITNGGFTSTANSLILVRVVTKGATVTSITGGSITFTLVHRKVGTNIVGELWQGFSVAAQSITVLTVNLSVSNQAIFFVSPFGGTTTSVGDVGSGTGTSTTPSATVPSTNRKNSEYSAFTGVIGTATTTWTAGPLTFNTSSTNGTAIKLSIGDTAGVPVASPADQVLNCTLNASAEWVEIGAEIVDAASQVSTKQVM